MSTDRVGKYSPREIVSFCLHHPEYLANHLRRLRPSGSYRATFYSLLLRQRQFADSQGAPFGSYYEFGVGGGGTLRAFLDAFRDFERTVGPVAEPFRVFAFDSFRGLPEPRSNRDAHPGWKAGSFAYSLEEVTRAIDRECARTPRVELRFIAGFYEESLTPALREELAVHPPSIVMVDVDFYSSTRTVLEWLRPMLRAGTTFYFDDVWGYRGDPEKGELAAIREFNARREGTLVNYPVAAGMNLVSPRYVFLARDAQSR